MVVGVVAVVDAGGGDNGDGCGGINFLSILLGM